jgi:hypothetical protein
MQGDAAKVHAAVTTEIASPLVDSSGEQIDGKDRSR